VDRHSRPKDLANPLKLLWAKALSGARGLARNLPRHRQRRWYREVSGEAGAVPSGVGSIEPEADRKARQGGTRAGSERDRNCRARQDRATRGSQILRGTRAERRDGCRVAAQKPTCTGHARGNPRGPTGGGRAALPIGCRGSVSGNADRVRPLYLIHRGASHLFMATLESGEPRRRPTDDEAGPGAYRPHDFPLIAADRGDSPSTHRFGSARVQRHGPGGLPSDAEDLRHWRPPRLVAEA
jgi:hypothetical protein